MPYGGFWRRFLAYLIDGLIIGAVLGAVEGIVFAIVRPEGGSAIASSGVALAFLALVATWLYYALMESSSLQATVGKMALAMRVTDLHGQRISFGRATGRFFAKILSVLIFYVGYIMVAFTPQKRGLHDYIAGTLVYKTWAAQAAAAAGRPGAPTAP